ncbi:MAG: hypothetical protein RLZZ478_257 [Actinomycetota bacterium]|jgi:hypothetical protein
MSANFSHLPAETQAMLADRYGIKERKSWRLIAILVALIGLPWLFWSAWHHSNPEIRVTLVSFQNEKADSIDITYLVQRRDPSTVLSCTLLARDYDKNVVGEIEDRVPASADSEVTITTTIPARVTPVNAAVLECRAVQQ